ncbi:MAG: hypothetical protein ACU0GG_20910 [Paracoccaceae bacterium]
MIHESDLQGHWARRWIKAPGFEDHTTRVHWMQAGRDYADVRIPLVRPEVTGAPCLSDLSADALCSLARAEGFAGHVTLEGDTCTWHREINWHGEPEGLDVGAISFDATGDMIEDGVLADYTELWTQKAKAQTSAIRFSNGHYAGVLVTDGTVGVVGIGPPEKPATAPVLKALEAGQVPENAGSLFDGVHALCRLSTGQAVATLATNPLIEGQPVLTFQETSVVWHKQDFHGMQSQIELAMETVLA